MNAPNPWVDELRACLRKNDIRSIRATVFQNQMFTREFVSVLLKELELRAPDRTHEPVDDKIREFIPQVQWNKDDSVPLTDLLEAMRMLRELGDKILYFNLNPTTHNYLFQTMLQYRWIRAVDRFDKFQGYDLDLDRLMPDFHVKIEADHEPVNSILIRGDKSEQQQN